MLIGLQSVDDSAEVLLEEKKARWLLAVLLSCELGARPLKAVSEVQASYEHQFKNFDQFWNSDAMHEIRHFGLIVV